MIDFWSKRTLLASNSNFNKKHNLQQDNLVLFSIGLDIAFSIFTNYYGLDVAFSIFVVYFGLEIPSTMFATFFSLKIASGIFAIFFEREIACSIFFTPQIKKYIIKLIKIASSSTFYRRNMAMTLLQIASLP